jgi:2-polyprenyl-3-methyl-5-hydroxy-6-metoxy-1,4-benzoquinol methylase
VVYKKEPFDACVSCYVLEHLEMPEFLFENLNKNIKPGGYTFLTAALTTVEIDHIA